MRIWLIQIGESLPLNNSNDRLLRVGILANLMVKEGHEVVWWASTFDHFRKTHIYDDDTTININKNFKLILLHSISYKRNVSLSRLINHFMIGQKFRRLAKSEAQPDIILCSFPTVELSLETAKYGAIRKIPVVLDIRDLWPDIFVDLFPNWLRLPARAILSPMFRIARNACSYATAITGINSAFVDWGVKNANRMRTALDRDFPLGYTEKSPCDSEQIKAKNFWKTYDLGTNDSQFVACFFGTIGRHFELDTIIEAARRLASSGRKIKFVICGAGEQLEYYRSNSNDCPNIIFPGWVDAAKIWTLMRLSTVGLAPYRSSPDFSFSLPNKSIEYLSAGLPIVSSLKGTLETLLSTYDCGVTYENGNPSSLETALVYLYDNRDRVKDMSTKGYGLFKERFVAEKVYGEMIEYLESIAANRSL